MDIIVTASDDPHGVVEFGQPSTVTVAESSLTLFIPVERHNGLVGDLYVNLYILHSFTAVNNEDFILLNHSKKCSLFVSKYIQLTKRPS